MPVSQRIIPTLTHRVLRRSGRSSAPRVNGEGGGYEVDWLLRCESIRMEGGPRVAVAQFSIVPDVFRGDRIAFDELLAAYSLDDQVKVVADPVDDPLTAGSGTGGTGPARGRVLFEGVLRRQMATVRRDEQTDDEKVTLTAFALPAAVDNAATEHLCIGRWMAVPGAPFSAMWCETPSLPAVFNFRGRPNMAPEATLDVGFLATAGGQGVYAPLWTDDADPAARYWTVREALQSCLAWLLYGSSDNDAPETRRPLNRTCTVAPATMVGLFDLENAGSEPAPGQFAGVDAQLTETSIAGLHVLDALDAVCRAGGFRLSLNHRGSDESGDGGRPYVLSIQRKSSGRRVTVDLQKRTSGGGGGSGGGGDAETVSGGNNVNRMMVMRDGEPLVSEVIGLAPMVIEARFPLKPLWGPAELASELISDSMQDGVPGDVEPEEQTEYQARHVEGGKQFDRYRHVGRAWGLMCQPFSDDAGLLYTTPEDWAHAEEGFDFVTYLDLNAAGKKNAIAEERLKLGASRTITWSRRVRQVLPLKDPRALLARHEHVLEVSEDAGATWAVCPHAYTVLPDGFGIMLTAANLATVNNGAHQGGEAVDVGASWYALVFGQALRFRITCGVECDNAARADATLQASSATRMRLGTALTLAMEERWKHQTKNYFAVDIPIAHHLRLGVFAGEGLDADHRTGADGSISLASTAVRDRAQSYRAGHEAALVSGTVQTWQMDFDRYRLGDCVTRIAGREYFLNGSVGGAVTPGNTSQGVEIVGLTIRLSPDTEQGMELTLDDHRLAVGR